MDLFSLNFQSTQSSDRAFIADDELSVASDRPRSRFRRRGPALESSDDEDDLESQVPSPPSPSHERVPWNEVPLDSSVAEAPGPAPSPRPEPSARDDAFLSTPPAGPPGSLADGVPQAPPPPPPADPQQALPLAVPEPAPVNPGSDPIVGRCRRFTFTVHGYNDEAQSAVRALCTTAKYGVFGREVCPTTGSRHLQGYLHFETLKSFNQLRKYLLDHGFPSDLVFWCEAARSDDATNRKYCIKEKDFEEFGAPTHQGQRSDLERFKDAVESGLRNRRELLYQFPRIVERMPRFTSEAIRRNTPAPTLRQLVWRPWQQQVIQILRDPPHDRHIHFFVDIAGGAGKTTIARECQKMFPDCQWLTAGPYKELAYMVDLETRSVILDFPRSCVVLPDTWTFCEGLKDGFVLSTKYEPMPKYWEEPVRVIIFMNEQPPPGAFSADRMRVTYVAAP